MNDKTVIINVCANGFNCCRERGHRMMTDGVFLPSILPLVLRTVVHTICI